VGLTHCYKTTVFYIYCSLNEINGDGDGDYMFIVNGERHFVTDVMCYVTLVVNI